MLILEQEKGRRLPPNPFTAFGVLVVARLVHFSQAFVWEELVLQPFPEDRAFVVGIQVVIPGLLSEIP